MFDLLPTLCLLAGLGLLIHLSIIDFKTLLLPNIYVFPFAVIGVTYHWTLDFYYMDWQAMAIGGFGAYTLLYSIRAAANAYYKQDSLGLGDVKLLAAGGLWLGLLNLIIAMSVGAFIVLLYGLGYAVYSAIKEKRPISIGRTLVPAGPGFAAGIVIMIGITYKSVIIEQFYTFFH